MDDKLFYLFLDLDNNSRHLVKAAISQSVLQIMYFVNKPITNKELDHELTSRLKADVKKKNIREAVSLLKNNGKISGSFKIQLTEKTRSKIEQQLKQYRSNYDQVIDKYFVSVSMDRAEISSWFDKAIAQFFEAYRFEWMSEINISGKVPRHKNHFMRKGFTKAISKEYGIEKEEAEHFDDAFFQFIKSEDIADATLLFTFGMCMFSSVLVNTPSRANYLTLKEMENSLIVFDTNVLLSVQLESHKYSTSFEALEKVFESLSIKPIYFFSTQDEYHRVLNHMHDHVKHIFSKYDIDVLKELRDDFVQTAITRGCKSEEDLNTYFQSIYDLPDKVHEKMAIEIVDYPELKTIIDNGSDDQAVMHEMNVIYQSRFPNSKKVRSKNKSALQHDAGLVAGLKLLSKTNTVRAISLDSTLVEYSAKHASGGDLPAVLSFSQLINILVLNSSASGTTPSDFAPLFSAFLRNEMLAHNDVFQAADLLEIINVKAEMAQLPKEKIVSIAKQVHKMKFVGSESGEIANFIIRQFRTEKVIRDDDIESARNAFKQSVIEIQQKDQEIEKLSRVEQETYDIYIDRYLSKAKKQVRNDRWKLFILFILAGVLTYIIELLRIQGFVSTPLQIVFSVLSVVLAFTIAKTSNLKLRMDKESSQIDAKNDAEKRLKELRNET